MKITMKKLLALVLSLALCLSVIPTLALAEEPQTEISPEVMESVEEEPETTEEEPESQEEKSADVSLEEEKAPGEEEQENPEEEVNPEMGTEAETLPEVPFVRGTNFSVEYLDKNSVVHLITDYNVINGENMPNTLGIAENETWYVVDGKVDYDGEGITVAGDVHLILKTGCSLTVKAAAQSAGICVSGNNSLTVYGQTNDTGKLTVTGGNDAAGIGGGPNESCGNITVNGGNVTAIGGLYGAGIGGGKGASGSNITINSGTVTATGGSEGGAGIGGGANGGNGSNITVNGGTVKATSKSGGGAAIGGGLNGSANTITVNGGTITAESAGTGAGIGGGEAGNGTNIRFNNGAVLAKSSSGDAIGRGSGGTAGDIYAAKFLRVRLNSDQAGCIRNNGSNLAGSIAGAKFARIIAPDYTIVLSGGKGYQDDDDIHSTVLELSDFNITAKNIDGIWHYTFSDVRFETTDNIALEIKDAEAVIELVGNNRFKSGDDESSSCGMMFYDKLVIQGQDSSQDTLSFTCGAVDDSGMSSYAIQCTTDSCNHELTITDCTVTAYGGNADNSYGILYESRDGTVSLKVKRSGKLILGGSSANGYNQAVDMQSEANAVVKETSTGADVVYSDNCYKIGSRVVTSVTMTAAHNEHDCDYTAEGNTITAICRNPGCSFTDSRITLTLNAENKTYSGNPYGGVDCETTAWTDAGLPAPTYLYEGRDGTTYAKSETVPTNAGKYTVSVKFGDAVACADFEITRRPITLTANDQSSGVGSNLNPLTYTSGDLCGGDIWTGALSTDADKETPNQYEILQGTLTIQDGNNGNNYDVTFTKGTYTVMVRQPQTLTFEKAPYGRVSVTGKVDPFTVAVTGAETPVTYTSSNPEIASVDPVTGEVTVHRYGKVVITAMAEEGAAYESATASYTLVICAPYHPDVFDDEGAGSFLNASEKTSRSGEDNVNPNTGDESRTGIWITLALVSVIGLGAVTVFVRRRKIRR